MGGVGRVACQRILVREACVGVLGVELDFCSLECNEVMGFEMSMGWCDFGRPVN